MNKINVKMITEAAMMIALGTVLGLIKLWDMPQGGSVTLASMVPILIFAYRWGGLKGILVGMIFGIVQFIVTPYPATIWATILDYPLAFGSIGIIGFFAYRADRFEPVVIGATFALLMRYVFHVISGVIFYAHFAPEGVSPIEHSTIYNLFILPEIAIALFVLALIFKRIKQIKI